MLNIKKNFYLSLFVLFSLISCTCKGKNEKITPLIEEKPKKNLVLIITGLSGSGKTTVAQKLIANHSVKKTISHTTRSIRKGEKKEIDYHFISKKDFQKMIKNHQFIEYSNHFNNFYGTSKKEFENLKNDLILVINEKGADKISKIKNLNLAIIYLDIEKYEMIKRITARDKINPKELKKRLAERQNVKILENAKLKNFYKIDTTHLNKEEVYKKVEEIYLNLKKDSINE